MTITRKIFVIGGGESTSFTPEVIEQRAALKASFSLNKAIRSMVEGTPLKAEKKREKEVKLLHVLQELARPSSYSAIV
jgi:hypothetical protein